jgi:N-acetylglucosaminyl-diphospho-decaprenol L-rhamnosyltransferase
VKPSRHIEGEARVLGLRLRLGLVDLAAIEQWAERALLEDDGSHGDLVELRVAQKAGETRTLVRLISLGEEPEPIDVMRALGAVKVEAQTQEELRKLADNLDPVLQEMAKRQGLPDLLKPALGFSGAFWRARTQSQGTAEAVEAEMRELLHAVKEYAAEQPGEQARVAAEQPPCVSAIVVSYRTGDVLLDCLRALADDADVAEIVLVDNGNPQDVLFKVDELFGKSGKLKITGGGQNRGFSAGVNLGAKTATGNRLLVLNPDAILQPGSIAALETARNGQAEPVVVGGKIHGEDGVEQRGARRRRLTLQSAAVTFLGMGWLRSVNPAFENINRNTEPEPAGPVPMDAVSGALMYLSRAGFERLGGFDEGYFLHVEDLDLCRRAEADGGSVIYTPHARALHHGATSDAPAIAVEFAETQSERTAAMIVAPLISLALVLRARLRKR